MIGIKHYILFFALCCISLHAFSKNEILLEAESFEQKGGWVIDNQSMMQMGSPYLLAHGLGIPVKDAATYFNVSKAGTYHLWVRTRDWCATWGRKEHPGRFQIKLNNHILPTLFGTERAEWHWQDAGMVQLKQGKNHVVLHDLTGFEGRCDALYFSAKNTEPPADRNRFLSKPTNMGNFDLVVVGGGIAGCCTALTAARLGCRVALVQNRPVLGGNNSSEIRVGLSGLIAQKPYEWLGYLMDELGSIGHWTNWEAHQDSSTLRSRHILSVIKQHPEKLIHNAGPESNYEDERKLNLIQKEKNIMLFLNTQVIKAKSKDNRIISIIGQNIETGKRILLRSSLFADCTGDGNLGYLAGADFRMGRESKTQTHEPSAPDLPDSLVMGTSVQWYSENTLDETSFPECPWALSFNDSTCIALTRGDWDWESGLNHNQIEDIEYIRDHALRALYGNWDYLKNHYIHREDYAKRKLVWAAYIGGKRESRRLLGDVILCEQDLTEQRPYKDASFTTTWGIDLHFPKQIAGFKGEPFLSYAKSTDIPPYAVPYRCLYSRNIDNLFMAGRDISVTHVALGTIRVMRTGGMMGEVVGMASHLCKKYHTTPRGVFQKYLDQLKEHMQNPISMSYGTQP